MITGWIYVKDKGHARLPASPKKTSGCVYTMGSTGFPTSRISDPCTRITDEQGGMVELWNQATIGIMLQ